MNRTPVTSSNIVSIGYEAATCILQVEFHGGRIYNYYRVPADAYTALMDADSIGKFLNSEIKPFHHFRLVSDDPAYNLSNVQRQLDADGVEVGVSRQALEEMLAELDFLRFFYLMSDQGFDPEREMKARIAGAYELTTGRVCPTGFDTDKDKFKDET